MDADFSVPALLAGVFGTSAWMAQIKMKASQGAIAPLICIEEPEIGLHPDMMSTIADLLVEPSGRTQLIVTTHSEALVSSLPPESVLVCERDYLGTHLRRLDPERLKKWLENYSLGELWSMGEIGGTRW